MSPVTCSCPDTAGSIGDLWASLGVGLSWGLRRMAMLMLLAMGEPFLWTGPVLNIVGVDERNKERDQFAATADMWICGGGGASPVANLRRPPRRLGQGEGPEGEAPTFAHICMHALGAHNLQPPTDRDTLPSTTIASHGNGR